LSGLFQLIAVISCSRSCAKTASDLCVGIRRLIDRIGLLSSKAADFPPASAAPG
jgi:hypothetical protein